MKHVARRIELWFEKPLRTVRLEIARIFAPLAILGFMSGRIIHADEWLGRAGFRVPPLHDNVRQPLYLPALPTGAAWVVVATMILTGVALSMGWWTRTSAIVFAATLAFVGLSDRAAAFTVSKIGPIIVLAIALGPSAGRLSVDAWRRRRRGGPLAPKSAPLGSLRFLQLMLIVFYCASGWAKAGGDWLTSPYLLWSDLHDNYQTGISFLVARAVPVWAWPPLQIAVLVFEALAPLWFGLRRTRLAAFVFGVGMHVMIGLMFGPVVWFALLMMTALVSCFAPDSWLGPVEAMATWLVDPTGDCSLVKFAARERLR